MSRQIGEGDKLILNLERICGKDYPIELIGFICGEKNKSFKFGIVKGRDEMKLEMDKNE